MLSWPDQNLNNLLHAKIRSTVINLPVTMPSIIEGNENDRYVKSIIDTIHIPRAWDNVALFIFGLAKKRAYNVEIIYDKTSLELPKEFTKRVDFLSYFISVNNRKLHCVASTRFNIGLSMYRRSHKPQKFIYSLLNFISKGELTCAELQDIFA